MAKRGRKCKYAEYVEPYLKEIEAWIGTGKTEAEVCKRLGVSEQSFSIYKHKFPELSEVIKKARQLQNYEVKKSLYKVATGYEYEEQKTITEVIDEIIDEIDPNTGKKTGKKIKTGKKVISGKTRIEKIKKHIRPDVGAIVFWLTNRDKLNWQNTQSIKHGGSMDFTLADLVVKAKDVKQNNRKDKASASK